MSYFFGFLFLLILIIALPYKAIIAIAVFFIASALIVQTTASFLCQAKIPFLRSIKSVIYVILFSIIASIFSFQLIDALSAPYLIFLAPVFVFLAQALGYSMALEIPLIGSAILSVCITFVGWLVLTVFGLSFSTAFHLVS